MNMEEDDNIRTEDSIENTGYTDIQLKKAGIEVSSLGGVRSFSILLDNGEIALISASVADAIYEYYEANGKKPDDRRILELIKKRGDVLI
ncbi:MAG: hypothetical protein K6F86_13175 [Lachnospiraceae bacterium]|nr:hypothetical protein [Lachnospiraceae bacterium]